MSKCKCPPPGLPGYMGTFADLMSLLMCFFVLLLSFAEMDVLKFKQIAGSMKNAFGVQNILEVKDIPKGTSVIAQEFRPGRPEPTPIDTIMQQTIDMTQTELEFLPGEAEQAGGQDKSDGKQTGGDTPQTSQTAQQAQQQSNNLAKALAEQLKDQIQDGAIEIEALGQQIIIRIREKASFPAGSAFLQPQFWPVIRKVAALLKDVPGEITISGHTDNVATENELFSSNWDLSTQRAVAVAHQMIKVPGFDQSRLVVQGMADTQPLVPNTTAENRRMNRRVEISIMQGKPTISEPISVPKAQ
ncbi:flagellar motor protein MotB [Aeromonas enteropelogenes]|uniref:Flagellar motor protein MotB n=2 Tax=Aeromonas TaxID=642 RepID=A0A175VKN5_AEREN|nr:MULTISPECIES: flagellar motor protein MotB [Aeromonas]KXU81039.1 flagellar motor protein MotB [Aeromonas enteropelogenes]MBL0457784.1 flagellar motor protein MotB [Aeromonas enteropelogenes]MBL0520640.1 flagellar motor protein MotB [Aeromonas enteropelogenes]MCZ0751435.1 flagellar motor protein MotB [Aeromonas enteropelogenes]QXC35734.1 flagellar motor protein MotB [Aeromonas sp. FDAARGOS 1407]